MKSCAAADRPTPTVQVDLMLRRRLVGRSITRTTWVPRLGSLLQAGRRPAPAGDIGAIRINEALRHHSCRFEATQTMVPTTAEFQIRVQEL